MEIYADIDQLHVFLLLLLFLLKKVIVSALSRNPQRKESDAKARNARCQTEIGPLSVTVDLAEQVIPISMGLCRCRIVAAPKADCGVSDATLSASIMPISPPLSSLLHSCVDCVKAAGIFNDDSFKRDAR
ncbi:MAG: hypothetical protein P4L91_00155 [Burkholderiaceae bacterium]|nr:hypothetical protein [Burkholderiaceae bacterium]